MPVAGRERSLHSDYDDDDDADAHDYGCGYEKIIVNLD